MLISKNWINDFVTLPKISDQELATRFTLATAEVEGVTSSWEHLAHIKVVEIKSLKPHPDADKLNLVTFDIGQGQTREVVCGAPNVAVGLRVPYAGIGVILPGGFTLEPKKIRGILSEGMLCSEKELGLGEGTAGLMDLKNYATKIGETLLEVLKMKPDTIIDVDNKSLTHRPDLWGHHGLAREFAAALNVPFKDPYGFEWYSKMEMKLGVEGAMIKPVVEADADCSAYLGLSLDNIKIGPSPKWLTDRLEAVGLRAINNMVDIGNYVMLELGIPLHIFDRDQIKGSLKITKLKQTEEFKTLDDVVRTLEPGDTVIADSEKTLVLAGIMGGASSSVSENTKDIFIEVANWFPASVRKTSSRLGLRTDSSQRYEKSLDSNLCRRTMLRALELVLELCPEAKVKGEIETYIRSEGMPLVLNTSASRVSKVLGKKISTDEMTSIFKSLGFGLEFPGDDGFEVTIPSYRTTKDIECEADLIEEIGRMIGYDSIDPVAPLMEVKPVRMESVKKYSRLIADFLVTRTKSLEVMTYPLVGEKLLKKMAWHELNEKLKLVNALSVEQDRMRPSLIPSVLEAVILNQKNFDQFSFFEMGRAYISDEKNFSIEENHLAIVMASKNKSRFLELVNTVEELLSYVRVSAQFVSQEEMNDKFPNNLIPKSWSGLHPYESLNVKIMGKFQGSITSIHPLLLRELKIKGQVSVALINLSAFDKSEMKDKYQYKTINKLPKSTFDCSVLVEREKPAASALAPLKKLKIKQLIDSKIVSIFPLNGTHNSVTLRSYFEDAHETMNSELLKEAEHLIIESLNKAGFPLKA